MTSPLRTQVARARLVVVIALAPFLALGAAGCPDKPQTSATDAAPPTLAPVTTTTSPIVDAAPSTTPAPMDAGRDVAEPRRYDPKYKCPTGQTHFYLEGDFCRKKCFSASDCAKGERCSAMEYPFLLDGGPAGSGRFCEGT